jgi:hypothetical protein
VSDETALKARIAQLEHQLARQPSGWGDDPLSEFIEESHANEMRRSRMTGRNMTCSCESIVASFVVADNLDNNFKLLCSMQKTSCPRQTDGRPATKPKCRTPVYENGALLFSKK